MMKIKKREYSNPMGTMVVWIMPTMTYTMLKLAGAIVRNEWTWYVAIPVIFTLWLAINFKLVKE